MKYEKVLRQPAIAAGSLQVRFLRELFDTCPSLPLKVGPAGITRWSRTGPSPKAMTPGLSIRAPRIETGLVQTGTVNQRVLIPSQPSDIKSKLGRRPALSGCCKSPAAAAGPSTARVTATATYYGERL